MGKNYMPKALNRAAIIGSYTPPVSRKENILRVDSHNANQDYRNHGYRLPNLEQIYNIPSSVKREWQKMSKTEKIVYGTIFASTVIGLGIAADYKFNEGKTVKNIGDYSKSAGTKVAGAASGALGGMGDYFKAAPPAIDNPVPAINSSASPTPETSFLYHDGIEIVGDKQFQKDNVMWMEFAKKYSPTDYEFIKKNNKYIDSSDAIPAAAAGGDSFTWNKSFLRKIIENKGIKEAVGAAAHESGHNSVFNTDRMNETYANIFAKKALRNLSYVNQKDIDNFYQKFNFSQFQK
jgi:hypothetical protein